VHVVSILISAASSPQGDVPVVATFNILNGAVAIPTASFVHIFGLTPAEAKVAAYCRMGLRVNEIAAQLKVSRETVRTELAHIFAKTGVSSQTELAALLGPLMISGGTIWG
jgi:DNA-binding CsgD family transcriptional regulator